MPLGNADLRSDRTRSPGGLLLDDAEAAHAYAWLFRNGPAPLAGYVEAVDASEQAAGLAVNRLHAHGLLTETEAGYEARPVNEVVEGVQITPGVAAVLAKQLENHAVRKLVRRHGSLALAEAVACWPAVRDGELESRDVGPRVGIGRHDGVTATNALRAVRDHLEVDPFLEELQTPVSPG